MNQADAILQALRGGRSLTPMEALSDFGVFRLGARIHGIRTGAEGDLNPLEEILVETVKTEAGKRVARYSLETENPDPSSE